MKNHFFGKYYKFISDDGYTFALIVSTANEGDMLQLVTPTKGYFIDDTKSVSISGDIIDINIHQDDISISGRLTLGELHPLKKKAMGPFSYLPMQCVHEIYSMYHSLVGTLSVNGVDKSFNNGIGYIEGDSGSSFPNRYIWYNSVTNDVTVTLAIATIPLLGFIHFKGILCFIKINDKEYRLCTYNFAKAKLISDKQIILKKGKYRFILDIPTLGGHKLKAPVKGDMVRYIKENLCIPTKYKLLYKEETLIEKEDKISSLEYMW